MAGNSGEEAGVWRKAEPAGSDGAVTGARRFLRLPPPAFPLTLS